MDNRPIGVFDSGIGGVTATLELERLMPREKIVFLGDSHNMPYGEKTAEEIRRMSQWDADFLLQKGVKAIFIACGTATTNALEELRKSCPVPVLGVVEPAVSEAARTTKNRRVGLLATRASVLSGVFQRLMSGTAPDIEMTVQACPKFVTMVEQGIFDKNDPRVQSAVAKYLPTLRSAGVDTVILGCTHYPLLSDVITEYMGRDAALISAGAAAARSLSALLLSQGLEGAWDTPETEFYTTGEASHFAETAGCILGRDISGCTSQIDPLIL